MRRQRIQDGDLVGVVVEPEGRPRGYAVVVGGSGGGVPEPFAERVARTGIVAFGVAYFGAPGLPPSLVDVPLERAVRAIELFRHEFARRRPVGLIGSSKGAELALCLAARVGELVSRVVAVSPTSVGWYGLDGRGRPSLHRPSFTWRALPVPYLPFRHGATPTYAPSAGLRVDACYEPSHYPPVMVDAATVEVERTGGPMLVLAGDDDHMWPSARMAARLAERLRAHGRSDACSVTYPGAGHTFLHNDPGRPVLRTPSRWDFGGTPEGDADACTDAWPRIGAFLAGE